MSSSNPVLVFPAALAARGTAIAQGFVASLTLGAGQFCTNPGIVLLPDGADADAFERAVAAALSSIAGTTMLTPGIHAGYAEATALRRGHSDLRIVAEGREGAVGSGRPVVFATTAAAFLADPAHSDEVFGATSIILRCDGAAAFATVIDALDGKLTITLQLDDADMDAVAPLIMLLERKAGRILANGWPTGVEVSRAMVHGGPYPATSDGRSTSVGTAAIERFLRPVCYRSLPDALLPAALRAANPLAVPRREF